MPALGIAAKDVVDLDFRIFRRPTAAILRGRHNVVPVAAEFSPGNAARNVVHVAKQQLDTAHFDGAIVQLAHLIQTHGRIFFSIQMSVDQRNRRRKLGHVGLGAEGNALFTLTGGQRVNFAVMQRIF
ncbi:hypothetical protein D3C78_1546170 [compost metagenome]